MEQILYILRLVTHLADPQLEVDVVVCKALADGAYGKAKPFKPSHQSHQALMQPSDSHILAGLILLAQHTQMNMSESNFRIAGEYSQQVLMDIVATGRSYWGSKDKAPLSIGPSFDLQISLSADINASELEFEILSQPSAFILPIDPIGYFSIENQQCGQLNIKISTHDLQRLFNQTEVDAEQRSVINDFFLNNFHQILKNQTIFKSLVQQELAAKPLLKFFGVTQSQAEDSVDAVAELIFIYGNIQVPARKPGKYFYEIDGEHLVIVHRDLDFEQQAQALLLQQNLTLITEDPLQGCYLIADSLNVERAFQFSEMVLPQLEMAAWQIRIMDSYPAKLIRNDKIFWYSELSKSRERDWFNLQVGIKVDEEEINLLPVLVQLIQKHFDDFIEGNLEKLPDDKLYRVKLLDGRYLQVPLGKVRSILFILTELYDKNALEKNQTLKLSRLRAAQLLEQNKTQQAVNLRWIGDDKLYRLGEKLANFTGIEVIEPAHNFQADLRPYQQQGLNWLQFLREYELGGILADDMGLGKTVQTLAHLSVEKEQGRINKPCLIITPTSLITNWLLEAKRFSPDLNCLVLHGTSRKQCFDTVSDYDLVFTTYPLMSRDKKFILQNEYHYLILDEAQIIKNPSAKATQIIQQIKANHRLCLTGTPLENHLGELWSVFNFLLPGLLGTQKQFRQVFRVPIEDDQNNKRQQILAKRVAPFLLRRTKKQVVKELPPKTEIIKTVELQTEQRQLYENIRMAMQARVEAMLQDQGLGRSQIVLLDALLKLRQVCCDPKLVQLDAAKNVNESAKMELLMDLLPNLIEEGRSVLLFSAFTSMLKIIADQLTELNIPFALLTGQTKDRQAEVERFQRGEVPLFLISLKAGGLGLNLTAADTVIHYDPWWNPAAEQQATDRAYRIGQDKPVFVYKLIVSGSVEEKILQMQSHKQALVTGLLQEQTTGFSGITQEDIQQLFSPISDLD